ncbi:MAG TPA: MlaD family protein [Solirubrobacteraceae bacterium]|jgi:phospholipid/cholesterol/gamma-HCH transport system substrate-binding protein|nr:MlaD family protein [Solirubrobacteraceae bacterium]
MIEVRDYRTEKVNRARLTLELKRAVRSGIVVAAGLVVGALIALHIAHNIGSSIGESSQTVSFRVANANDVVAGSDEVRYLGIPVGRVGGVAMDGSEPVITASFDTQYGHIYRNATAVIRPNTALEDMYVDITNPGTRSAGLASAAHPLQASQVDTSVNLDDVLNVFNADARTSLRSLLNNMGNGLADRGGALKEGFVEAVPFIQVAGRLAQQLADRAPLVKQLVHNTAILTADLGANQTSLRQLISSGSATLGTIQDHAGAFNDTLAALPGTLTDLHSSLSAVSGVLGDVDTAVRSLYPVADQLPTDLTAVRRLSASASPAVAALQKPVQKLTPLIRYLVPLSANLSLTVSRLLPQIPVLNKATNDLAQCRQGVQGFFEWNPSLAKYGDERGQSPRGNVAAGAQSSGVLTDPFEQAETNCDGGTSIGGAVVTPADDH